MGQTICKNHQTQLNKSQAIRNLFFIQIEAVVALESSRGKPWNHFRALSGAQDKTGDEDLGSLVAPQGCLKIERLGSNTGKR